VLKIENFVLKNTKKYFFKVNDTTKYDDKVDGIADPCSEASLFWGDQALTEDDVKRIFGRSTEEVENDLKQATELGWTITL